MPSDYAIYLFRKRNSRYHNAMKMNSSHYDRLMVETLGNTHLKPSSVYYDEAYEKALFAQLGKDSLLKTFEKELKRNSQGVKMCSIASSSRLGYLASKKLYPLTHYEKNDLRLGCCAPNYDGYDANKEIFYEFKCHEFCKQTHGDRLTNSYIPLLEQVYGIKNSDPKSLRFSDFKMEVDGDPSIYEINFDFKQFLCHIFGILSLDQRTLRLKPTLKYVIFVPKSPFDEELRLFITEILRDQIQSLFRQFRLLPVTAPCGYGIIDDFLDLLVDIVPADAVNDFILKSLD
mgnify:CR=1 FL=1